MNVEELTDALWQRLEKEKPRALLLGQPPWNYHKYDYVKEKPYDAIVLGRMPPGMLLHMPDEAVCQALLEGMPVYLWHDPSQYRGGAAPALQRALLAAERRLMEYGAQPIGREERLITAQRARQLRQRGETPPMGSRLTPLARDILEGKET